MSSSHALSMHFKQTINKHLHLGCTLRKRESSSLCAGRDEQPRGTERPRAWPRSS